jgi:hypothetical protein
LAQLNAVTGFTSTLNLVQPTGGNQLFNIPDQGAAGTYDLLTTAAADSSYLKLQGGSPPGTAQTGNFNITGTGIAGSLQAGSFDTASAAALGIGGTNATSINIGNTTSNITTTVNGTLTVKPSTGNDSSTLLHVQNAAGTSLLNVNSSNGDISIGVGTSGPTFGKTTIGASTDTGDRNTVNATKYTTGATAGATSSIWVYVNAPIGTAPNNKFTMAIYSNNAGAPQNLLATSSEGTLTAGWNSVNISTTLLPSTTYWLAYNTNGSTSAQNNMAYDTGAAGSTNYLPQTYSSGFPATFAPGSTSNQLFSMYVSFAANAALTVKNGGNIGIGTSTPTARLQVIGNSIFQSDASNPTALQVQNAAGNSVLSVDTSTSTVTLGKASSLNGTLVFANSTNGNTVTLQSGATTTSYTALLPSAAGAVGQCLAVVGVVGSTQTLGYSSCALATGGGYVTLQGATPGVADSGSFNINGTGIVSNFKVSPTVDSASILQVSTNSGNSLLNVNSSNSYVIDNGTKSLGNEVQNPSFEAGGSITTSGQQGWAGPAQASIVNGSTDAKTGNYELQFTPNGTTLKVYSSQYIEVNAGDVVYTEGWVKNSAGANGVGGVFLESYDKDRASVGTTSDAASLPGTSYVLRKVNYTVPSGVKFVRIGAVVDSSATAGTYYFDDFYAHGSVAAPAVFQNSADSSTAFLIQSAGAGQTLFTANTTDNVLKVGDSTGTDTDTTIFVLDSASANPTTNLAGKDGGLFYRSDTNTLKAIIGGAVVDICTTAATCAGYSASAASSIQLQPSSPGSAQTGNFNITGTGILSQLQSSDSSTASTNSSNLTIRTGNATGTTSNSGNLILDVGTATGTLGQIQIGHSGVTTLMPGMLDIQGNNALKLGTSGSSDGSILFRNSVGSNTITLKAPATDPASSITLTLPTALGSAGYCLKDTGGGALGFSDCGVGATVTLQNVYDYSSPANILLADAKDFSITAQDTGTDPSILFKLQCTNSCGNNGRFAIQDSLNNDVFSVKPNGGGITLGVSTQIGSATTDGTQYNLQLDSSSTFGDSGSCTTTTNQGAMYYNTVSQSIRTCQDSGWADVVTTRDLGLLLFGVVPDSGVSNVGDLPSLVTPGASGPCKVSYKNATQVHVEACVAYSGGRRVSVTPVDIPITGMTTTNIWANICLTGGSGQPALSVAASSETSTTAGFFPSFDISAPVLCLAQIKGSTSAANNIAQIYDVRTFSNTQKLPMLASTALSLGMLADVNPSTAIPSVSGSRRMIGVVVATNGSTSSTSPNVILTTFGPAWVKSTAGSAGDFVIQSSTNGYTQTNTNIPNNSFNYEVGITPTSFSSSCTAASNCSGSLFVNFQVR